MPTDAPEAAAASPSWVAASGLSNETVTRSRSASASRRASFGGADDREGEQHVVERQGLAGLRSSVQERLDLADLRQRQADGAGA